MSIFKNNWTKWEPLHHYNHNITEYLILIKVNKKSGLPKFKVKCMNPNFLHLHNCHRIDITINANDVFHRIYSIVRDSP